MESRKKVSIIFHNKHVHLVIYDRYLRYIVSKKNRLEDIVDSGELLLKEGLIKDGRIMDKEGFHYHLERIVKQKKWKRANISFIVSDGFVAIRHHQIPAGLKKEETKAVLQREAKDQLRLPFQDPIIDFGLIKKLETTNEILVFAYPRDVLNPYLAVMESVHLNPVIADVSSLALSRVYQQFVTNRTDEQDTLILQWGKDGLVLAAFEHGLIVFSRHVPSPTDERMWSWSFVRNKLEWNGSEEDLQELMDTHLLTIERFLDFYRYSVQNGEKAIEKIVIAGDFPFLDLAIQLLSEQTKVPVIEMGKYLPKTISVAFSDLAGLLLRGNSK
jgi:type IV pilus assembly protein PilM